MGNSPRFPPVRQIRNEASLLGSLAWPRINLGPVPFINLFQLCPIVSLPFRNTMHDIYPALPRTQTIHGLKGTTGVGCISMKDSPASGNSMLWGVRFGVVEERYIRTIFPLSLLNLRRIPAVCHGRLLRGRSQLSLGLLIILCISVCVPFWSNEPHSVWAEEQR